MRPMRLQWRLGIVVACGLAAGLGSVGALVRTRNAARTEVEWLRQRLADKRDVVRDLRNDLAAVAVATERVSQLAGAARERNRQVRQAAGFEAARDQAYTPARIATLDELAREHSEAAGHALARLEFVEEQLAATTDSMALMMVAGKGAEPCAAADAPPRAESPRLPAVRSDEPVVQVAVSRRLSPSVPSGWPVQGDVSSGYGWRESPYGRGVSRHAGVDIRAAHGTPVGCSAPGTVIFAGRDSGGYGNAVIVDHGRDVKTLYGHLSGIYVGVGQQVARGQSIGSVGATGRATGVHLHYEVRMDDEPVDPMAYLRGRGTDVALVSSRRR